MTEKTYEINTIVTPIVDGKGDNEEQRLIKAYKEYEEHIGFCLGPYKPETCNSCYCELECLELRVRELMEYV